MDISEFRKRFEPYFKKELVKLINRAKKISSCKEFNDVISHIENLAKNGKRIRPYLINLSYGPTKLNTEIINQIIGVELLHIFALIHDDIMDGAKIRHGVRTINTIHKNSELSKSYAMLAGDMVFNWAYECFLKDGPNKKSLDLFQSLIEEVIVGQAIDATLPYKDTLTEKEIREKNLLKTARYTFRRPIEIGLVLANKDVNKNHGKLGENLGALFQIDDDLLDIFGDEKKLNKKTFQDIESKQATLISFYLKDNKAFKKYFGKKLNAEERARLRDIIEKSGTLEKIELERKEIILNTKKLIENFEGKETWLNFMQKIITREK
jgi:geranylgeranyl pyrophosphate synthase